VGRIGRKNCASGIGVVGYVLLELEDEFVQLELLGVSYFAITRQLFSIGIVRYLLV
jgi:hypothetical protein